RLPWHPRSARLSSLGGSQVAGFGERLSRPSARCRPSWLVSRRSAGCLSGLGSGPARVLLWVLLAIFRLGLFHDVERFGDGATVFVRGSLHVLVGDVGL